MFINIFSLQRYLIILKHMIHSFVITKRVCFITKHLKVLIYSLKSIWANMVR